MGVHRDDFHSQSLWREREWEWGWGDHECNGYTEQPDGVKPSLPTAGQLICLSGMCSAVGMSSKKQ